MKPRHAAIVLMCAFLFATAARAQSPAPAARAEAAGPAPFAAALQPFVDSHLLAGAVALVADGDRILSVEAVGFADIAGRKPMRTDSTFWIASQSKSIAAAALMMLVDEGKVALDAPVETYLPEFKGLWMAVEHDDEHMLLRRPKRSVIVRDLLTHSSGLVHFLDIENPGSSHFELLPLREATRLYAATPLHFEPGSGWKYCNAGLNTAGRIIEVVSGKAYEYFLAERLFGPLDMRDTTFSPDRNQIARLAKSYRPDAARQALEETTLPIAGGKPLDGRRLNPLPSGGLFSTARDVARFCQMMLNQGTFQGRRYLSESAVRQMTTRQMKLDDEVSQGLGWFMHSDGSFDHGGAYATLMTVDPPHGQVRVLLMQHAGFLGDQKPMLETFKRVAIEQSARSR